MKKPTEYPRRILLAVAGLTPQVVTETLYGLSQANDRFVPTEVHLLTTLEGALRAVKCLFAEGWFDRMCRECCLDGISFTAENIHVITDGTGRSLDDIRTAEDNACAADSVTDRVRRFTADPESALHVSLAGGRKTMSFFAGYALSLFARPQDRLSHVLVNAEFEFAADFFFPSAGQRVLSREGRWLDAASAKVAVAEIPIVSLRHVVPEPLRRGTTSFREVVRATEVALGPPELLIDQANRRIRAGGKVFDLNPSALALLSVFARRAQERQPALAAPAKPVETLVSPDRAWAERFLREMRRMYAHEEDIPETTRSALLRGMDGDYFSMQLSRLHKDLRRNLGSAAESYLIDNGGMRPCRYSLTLAPEAIRFCAIPKEEADLKRMLR